MPFNIIRNDITKLNTDAIVNAANSELLAGGGVCGAIFTAAGYENLQEECNKIGHCNIGDAVITNGYNMPCKYIIHTVGPIYGQNPKEEENQLYSCYKSSLNLAKDKGLSSIAFPLISSGIYGYPKADALKIATRAIKDFLQDNEMDIYLVVYDRKAFEISNKLFDEVQSYIDETLVKTDSERKINICQTEMLSEDLDRNVYPCKMADSFSLAMGINEAPSDLEKLLEVTDAGFSETLLRLIDRTGKKDSEIYKKANIDRKLFSKIRNNPGYKPSKSTAIAFAIALELNLDETKDLIERAGYALSHSSKFDIIIEYFITNKDYDMFKINETLFAFDQNLLGV